MNVIERIKAGASAPQPIAPAEEQQPTSETNVLLITHLKDQIHAFEIAALISKRGFTPFLNQETSDPADVFDILERRLQLVEKLIVFYGSVARYWVQQRFDEVMKIASEKGLHLKLGLYPIMPLPKEDLNFGRGFIQINVLEDQQRLFSFLEHKAG